MSTPIKPWEGNNFAMNQNSSGMDQVFGGTLSSQSTDNALPSSIVGSGRPVVTALGPGSQQSTLPPPLPQRNQRNNNGYNSYSQPYSRMGMGYNTLGMGMGGYPYNGYGGFNSYGGYPRRLMGGYGLGYGSGFGSYQDEYDASMMQAIDESCQTLFGPFDALVRSISSIAMVLDSTHQAMQFSFRTVLSAADSLSKLKNLFIELASSFSIIRLIKTFYYKILRLLGLINGKTLQEKQWAEMFDKAGSSIQAAEATASQAKPSAWLALGFFSLMMGGPYLMFKLFAQNINGSPKNELKVGPDSLDAIVIFDFDATSEQELSMKRGDRLKVARANINSGWALATNGVRTGYVPSNRIQLISMRKRPGVPAIHQPVYSTQTNGSILNPNQPNIPMYPSQNRLGTYQNQSNMAYQNQSSDASHLNQFNVGISQLEPIVEPCPKPQDQSEKVDSVTSLQNLPPPVMAIKTENSTSEETNTAS